MFTQTSYAQSANHKHRLQKLKAIAMGGKAKTDPLVKDLSIVFKKLQPRHSSHPASFCPTQDSGEVTFCGFSQLQMKVWWLVFSTGK